VKSALLKEPEEILLTLSPRLENDLTYTLMISGLEDLSGNPVEDTVCEVLFHRALPYEVVFNEIMPDPTPVVGLPDAEYIELFNASGYSLHLKDWTLTVGSTELRLPTVHMPEGSYLVLCGQSEKEALQPFTNALGLDGFPALLNGGQRLLLSDPDGQIIHQADYTLDWYRDENKALGGWSLEQIDPRNPCGGHTNWLSSVDPTGGTPGKINSVYGDNPDQLSPVIDNVAFSDSVNILVTFSEPMDAASMLDLYHYEVDQGVGHPEEVNITSPNFLSAELLFTNPFLPSTVYQITCTGALTDCAGNPLVSEPFRFAIPVPVSNSDIVINEIMVDPPPGGADYVELFNRSDKVIDLRGLYLASREAGSDLLISASQVAPAGKLMFPGEYALLTENADFVATDYFSSDTSVFIEMTSLPVYKNESGTVVLTDRWFQTVDEVRYSEEMHFPLIDFTEGISLERLNPERYSGDLSNWHSASSTSGYGTPGIINSQYSESTGLTGEVSVEPDVFSPDNDGYKDVVNVHYRFDVPGFTATITVFDSNGRMVKRVIQNALLGATGTSSWNGTDDSGQRLPTGIYLIIVEAFDLNGRKHHFKRTCVLARKLQ
jgi:hypothetical protein